MKGGFGPAKRRWKGLAIGVLFLVFLSMLVPLAFLLGLHNGFHSPGLGTAQQTPAPNGIRTHGRYDSKNVPNQSESDKQSHNNDPVGKVRPTLPKETHRNTTSEVKNETVRWNATPNNQQQKGTPVHPGDVQSLPSTNHTTDSTVKSIEYRKGDVDESRKLCEQKFGSYCLWREENKEKMKDLMVKKLKDLLFVARSYYPTIAKIPTESKFTHEMKVNIQDFERVLSESTTDLDLPPQPEDSGMSTSSTEQRMTKRQNLRIEKKLQKMEAVIARAKSFPVDCNNIDKKLRQIYDMTEDEANFHMKQSAFLYQLAVQTIPKSLHCLSMKLTVEYFKSPLEMELSHREVFSDPLLQHYVIISNNVLASSVVVNSTVRHARESRSLVFHVLTDRQNYYAMKLWFYKNSYREAAVEVLNIEQLNYHDKTTSLHLSLPVEFRVSFHTHDKMHYLTTFSHSHYLLPKIFQNLSKIVILDEDVVVQHDLSALWSLNMNGKVNGAVQLSSVRLDQLKSYIGPGSLSKNSFVWMSGLNIIDLARWRELDLTESYWRLVREMSVGEVSAEGVALRANFLTFQGLIYALEDFWVLPGLGHDHGISTQAIRKAPVLHYNGNMKPWLDLGIPKYKVYWRKFLNREDPYLSQCNVNP